MLKKDLLKEIATISAGNASKALSALVNRQVKVEVPEVFEIKTGKLVKMVKDQGAVFTVVSLKIVGDLDGGILLFLSPEDAKKLSHLLGESSQRLDIDVAFENDALKEVGNMISGSALNALSQFLGINALQSIPTIDPQNFTIENEGEQMLVFKINLSVVELNLNTEMLFVFDENSTARIEKFVMEKIKVENLLKKG